MRWTWFLRRRDENGEMKTMADSAQRRLDAAERKGPAVDRAVRRLDVLATRNNFAPMIRRALGDHR